MDLGARWAGQSSSETANLLGFSPSTIFRFTEKGPKIACVEEKG